MSTGGEWLFVSESIGRIYVGKACTRWTPCGKRDCTQCYPGKVLPPDQRGRLRPGGARKRARPEETGYRLVHPLADEGEGEVFSTPDIALKKARAKSKAEDCSYYVYASGRPRWLVYPDGEVTHYPETEPG